MSITVPWSLILKQASRVLLQALCRTLALSLVAALECRMQRQWRAPTLWPTS